MIYNGTIIDHINKKYKGGERLKRSEKVYYNNRLGLRKSNLTYTMDPWELDEYIKCKMDIKYFIERYLGVNLRDVQKNVIDSYMENRFNIYMLSSQTGLERLFMWISIHRVVFNNDKTVLFVQRTKNTNLMKEIVSGITKLPFFLKQGVEKATQSRLSFENKSRIIISSSKNSPMGQRCDDVFVNDFAFYTNKKAETLYTNLIPSISVYDSKLTLISTPNGFNKFYELVRGSELDYNDPGKNQFVTTRIYWWEVFGNDIQWKSNMIMKYGQEHWDMYFDMKFISK
jgi:hypothetical protein